MIEMSWKDLKVPLMLTQNTYTSHLDEDHKTMRPVHENMKEHATEPTHQGCCVPWVFARIGGKMKEEERKIVIELSSYSGFFIVYLCTMCILTYLLESHLSNTRGNTLGVEVGDDKLKGIRMV